MTVTEGDASALVVPAVDVPSSTAVLRSLGRRGIDTVAVSEHDTPPAFSSRYCDETVRTPAPATDLEGYRDALLAVARRDSVGAVVPMREADVYLLAKHRATFAEHVEPLWPTRDQLATVQDRERLFSLAADLDIPMPATSLLGDVDDWTTERIVKARYALLTDDHVESRDVPGTLPLPKTVFLEPGVTPDVATLKDEFHHEPIVQEYVQGTEYTFRGIFDHGEPVATTLKRLVRGVKYSRGPSICHAAADVPELEAHGLRLLEELEWHGLASVGFITDAETGAHKLMEVNPRFWANLPMDLHAGVDLPYYYWCQAVGTPDRIDPEYTVGTASHLLRGELSHLRSVLSEDNSLVQRPSGPGTVREILTSLYDQPNFDYLSLEDPGPFARDTANVAARLLDR